MPNARPTGGLLGGYALSFPDSQSSFPGYDSGSRSRITSGVADIGFNPRVAPSSPFDNFAGYGPNGFFDSSDSRKGVGSYDTIDAGAFGNINKGDYKKLGLDTVTNSFNKTKEFETRSSTNTGRAV
ncbi:hypothetical protein ElyMa_002279700 [Elysia marginata]|uniref:Uncharacterized protein n=1 Tax=Elysia marginata TaxID=1093978 RepID=A0AAV4FZZ9_9GAST|nr:hypothetical protein ElyMa_002279700 [Elysia marginata]